MRHDHRPDLPAVVIRRRDAGTSPLRRARSFEPRWRDAAAGQPRRMTMLASTADAVDWGGYREILVHEASAVDFRAATALLVNHDPNRIAGTLSGIRVTRDGLEAEAELLAGATLDSGVSVEAAIAGGALRGVSIGYWYRMEDTEWDEATRTLTVRRWRLLEASLTPIPADDEAGLRTRSSHVAAITTHHRAAAPIQEGPMTFAQWLAARGLDISNLSVAQRSLLEADYNAERTRAAAATAAAAPAAVAQPVVAPAAAPALAPSENGRAAAMVEQREIAQQARSVGLDAADFVGMTRAEARDAMLLALANRNATAAPAEAAVQVVRDQGDKFMARCRGALSTIARVTIDPEHQAAVAAVGGARAMPMKSMLRALARMDGHTDADYWSDMQLAAFGSGMIDLRSECLAPGRRSANKITAGFSTLLANVANKALMAGLTGYNAATWQAWCSERNVANFLQVTNAGLASGRLTKTAEGEAFPELLQKDGGYNSQLGMYGATVNLSFQAILNDQLGQFMDSLRRIGGIAAQTVDRRVYSILLNATWTNDDSTSAGLATATNIDKPRAALKNKLSPAGEKLGVVARFLLHDPANANNAQVATGQIYGPGQTIAPSIGARAVQTIESQWIGDTGLYGSALTTDYYLTGDKSVVDTVLVNFLEGVGFAPIIMPFDAGAVAAEAWKVMLPFEAAVATHVDSAGNTRVSGMQRGKA